jgi:hypothetical protein
MFGRKKNPKSEVIETGPSWSDAPVIRRTKKSKDRSLWRRHFWKLGQHPRDPDSDNPNVEYVNLGEMIERDAKRDAEAKAALARWEPSGGPESGIPCQTCGQMTRIVASKLPAEILTAAGLLVPQANLPPEQQERILALACPRCERVVMQLRESTLPRRV